MADIEHIKINGDTYDVSDLVARENAENAQNSANTAQSTADSANSAVETEKNERQSADKSLQSDITTLQEQHVFCTQSEYDALPDTKLTDGVIYFISTT